MKELSIEEKAKRYDDRLEKAKKWYDSNTNEGYRGIFEDIFPELKESKDEKIKKVIYSWIYTQPSQFFDSGFSKEEMLAWLEKQGEQKPVIEMKSAEESLGIDSNTYNKIVDECIYGEQKSDDVEEVNFFDDFRKTDSEVEPKFKVEKDKWYVCTSQYCNCIEGRNYKASLDGRIIDDYGTEYDMHDDAYRWFRPWTIEDAKPGDVLADECGIYIFNSFDSLDDKLFICKCAYQYSKKVFEIGGMLCKKADVCPATKEQHDTLMKAMADVGYTFDLEKKELKKIEQKPVWSEEDDKIIEEIINDIECARAINYHDSKEGYEFRENWLESLKDRVLPKSTWNEEDITKLKSAITLLQNPLIACDEVNDGVRIKTVDWLKSIEGKVLLQPKQEWSEENERIYRSIMYSFAHNYPLTVQQQEFVKSLKDKVQSQNTWKPSDGQMRVLDLAIRCGINRGTTEETTLVSLFNDLKKLI